MFPNLVEYTALIAGAVSVIVIALCWVRYYPEHEPDEAAKPLPPRELPALNGLPYIPVGSTHCRP